MLEKKVKSANTIKISVPYTQDVMIELDLSKTLSFVSSKVVLP